MAFNVEGQTIMLIGLVGWKLMKMVHKQSFLWQTWKSRKASRTLSRAFKCFLVIVNMTTMDHYFTKKMEIIVFHDHQALNQQTRWGLCVCILNLWFKNELNQFGRFSWLNPFHFSNQGEAYDHTQHGQNAMSMILFLFMALDVSQSNFAQKIIA